MNQKIVGTIFVVVQRIGAAVLLLVGAAHLPITIFDSAAPFAAVSLCPAPFMSTWLLDPPQITVQGWQSRLKSHSLQHNIPG